MNRHRGIISLGLIAAIAAGVFVLGMFATIKVQHANNVALKTRATAAESANAALDADCKKKIGGLNQQLADIAKRDTAAAERARKAKAAAEKANAATKAKADALAAQAMGPPAPSADQQCAAAASILSDVAKARAQ